MDIKAFFLNKDEKYIAMREKRWKEQGMKHHGRDITWKFYVSLLEKQDYRCALCGMRLDFTIPQLDHDHRTGEVRGILCYDCNRKRVGLYEKTGHFKGKYYEELIEEYFRNPPASHIR